MLMWALPRGQEIMSYTTALFVTNPRAFRNSVLRLVLRYRSLVSYALGWVDQIKLKYILIREELQIACCSSSVWRITIYWVRTPDADFYIPDPGMK
ncbi:hypothetical protein CEXT_196061 [Caerostris extrusa]|uniref:Uncharacterized protein n=1 Tax=Caerostris extrusa TaxID=172846 RepID=A0AAV4RRI0_CAEEX|nr:hypothetical protein CEXT_196061 [Caerostris extrusa]